MPMNYYLLQVTRENEQATTVTGKPKKGYARIKFLDIRKDGKPDQELYDLRGLGRHHVKFKNWVAKEFGYLRYEVEFG